MLSFHVREITAETWHNKVEYGAQVEASLLFTCCLVTSKYQTLDFVHSFSLFPVFRLQIKINFNLLFLQFPTTPSFHNVLDSMLSNEIYTKGCQTHRCILVPPGKCIYVNYSLVEKIRKNKNSKTQCIHARIKENLAHFPRFVMS